MILEVDKYRAQFFQIGGLCLMSPLGKLILDLPDFNFIKFGIRLLIYVPFSIMLFYFGMIVILHGMEILEK